MRIKGTVPLNQKVALNPNLTGEGYRSIEARGLLIPGEEGPIHLSGSLIVDVANEPVADSLKTSLRRYQVSQGEEGGLRMFVKDVKAAKAARQQFADALIPVSSLNENQ